MIDDVELARLKADSQLLRSHVQTQVKLKRAGREWVGLCPFHKERTGSFYVYPDGHYHCFGCKAHGTIIDWIMHTKNLSVREAIEFLTSQHTTPAPKPKPNGEPVSNGKSQEETPAEEWLPIVPPPKGTPEPTTAQLTCDTGPFEYRDTNEQILLYVRRWEKNNARPKKLLTPLTYGVLNGKKGWHPRGPDNPKPLYGLNLLPLYPTHKIIVAEGEIKADAINRMAQDENLPFIGMSWMGGAAAVANTDYAPLKGRHTAVWPDPDKGGREAGDRLRKLLKPICKSVLPLDIEGLPAKFDAAILEQEGGSLNTFLKERLKKPYRNELAAIAKLEGEQFMPLKWILPTYITEGCTILAGKPKIGKSWFILAASLAIAKGGKMLEQSCAKRGVLYAALEDSPRRMKDRATKICEPGWPNNLYISYKMPPIDDGGIEDLEMVLDDHPEVGAVFIDTLARMQGKPGKNETPYQHDYRTIALFSDLSRRTGVAIIIVHHVRKAETGEVFDAVLGTTGLTGAADTIIILTKTATGLRLSVRGRDVEELDHLIDFDSDTGAWSYLGPYEPDPEATNTRNRITGLLSQSKYPMKPKDIAENLGVAAATVRKQLTRLLKEGKISKTGYGTYSYT